MAKGGNMDILKSIEEAVVKRDIEGVKALTQKALDQKIPPNDILNKGLIKAWKPLANSLNARKSLFLNSSWQAWP
jgi:methanogenic corrinoid protein MtbC1